MMILMAYGLKAVLMIINKHSNPMPKVQIARRLETSSKWKKSNVVALSHSFFVDIQMKNGALWHMASGPI